MMRKLFLATILALASAQAMCDPLPGPPSTDRLLKSINPWSGLNSQPRCILTDAAIVAVTATPPCASNQDASVAYDDLTLTANGHLLGCPPAAPPTSGSGILFRINEGVGPYTITPAGCWYFPSSGALDGQGHLALSGMVGGVNQFYCELFGVNPTNGFKVQYECGAPSVGLGSATVYVANTPTLGAACGSGVTTCAASTLLTTGDTLAIFVQDCGNNANCTSGSLVTVSSASGTGLGTCTKFTGAEGGGNGLFTHWLYCPITSGGSLTVTVTWSSATNFPTVGLIDLHNAASSPDAGIGNTATGSGTVGSVATNGNTQQSNGFVLSGFVPLSPSSITAGGTVIFAVGSTLVQYQNAYSPGATATGTGTWGSSTGWSGSAVEVLHN